MKWDKAIAKIEKITAQGKTAQIEYRVRYDRYMTYCENVEKVGDYEYHGEDCKAIHTSTNLLDETSHTVITVKEA